MQNNFNQFSEKYTSTGKVGGFLVNSFYKQITSLIKIIEDDITSVLEVGAGQGYSTERIMSVLPPEVTFEASEYELEQVEIAKQRLPDIEFKQESLYELDRTNSSIDLILCLEVLEHLESPEQALEELKRVANKYVIISTPREPLWCFLNMCRGKYLADYGNTPGHIQHWSSNKLKKLLSKHFDVIDTRLPIPWQMHLLKKR